MSDLTKTVSAVITPAELATRKDAFIVDVRSPLEFETERISESINIPLPELELRTDALPSDRELIVVCRSGKRAERGAHTLLSKGFRPKVLDGGMLAWRKAGLPVVEGKKMLSIERQIQLIVGIGVLTGVVLGHFVNSWFLLIPAFFAAGLTFAGATGTCGLGMLLTRAPWNRLPTTQHQSKGSCCSN